jgi:hypothetical protein
MSRKTDEPPNTQRTKTPRAHTSLGYNNRLSGDSSKRDSPATLQAGRPKTLTGKARQAKRNTMKWPSQPLPLLTVIAC